jgi:hypothetical protein
MYKGFQQFGVVFPFEYVVQDSAGMEKNWMFHSVKEIADWRKRNYSSAPPSIYSSGRYAYNRVLFEGYPSSMYGTNFFERIPSDISDTLAIVTYVLPYHKTDYYFKKAADCWTVFKSVHKSYSVKELKSLNVENFENFLLRQISDNQFHVANTQWPLSLRQYNIDDGSSTITYLRKKDYQTQKGNSSDHPVYMAVYAGAEKKTMVQDTMYVHALHEGGVSCGDILIKVKDRWKLIEVWDASN